MSTTPTTTTTEEEESPELIACEECGTKFDPEQTGSYIEGIGDVCRDCADEAGQCCALCDERYSTAKKYWSGLIIANHEFAAEARLWVPGFYLPIGTFYYGGMITCHISGNDLLFAGSHDPDLLPETSGYVCAGCGSHHAAAARLYYGERPRKEYSTPAPIREKEHHWMRTALKEHPHLLEAHECDPEELDSLCRSRDTFWEVLGIPPMRTATEWTLLDYKGVRVYSTSQSALRPDKEVGWLTMDPSPAARNDHTHEHFSTCNLPGYLRDWWRHRHYYSREYELLALRHAIDHGHLQNGVPAKESALKQLPRDWHFKGYHARREWETCRENALRYALRWQSEAATLAAIFADTPDFYLREWTDAQRLPFLEGWNSYTPTEISEP